MLVVFSLFTYWRVTLGLPFLLNVRFCVCTDILSVNIRLSLLLCQFVMLCFLSFCRFPYLCWSTGLYYSSSLTPSDSRGGLTTRSSVCPNGMFVIYLLLLLSLLVFRTYFASAQCSQCFYNYRTFAVCLHCIVFSFVCGITHYTSYLAENYTKCIYKLLGFLSYTWQHISDYILNRCA